MQKKLVIAMDIDGTIINSKGELDPDVYSLFKKADLERTEFILTSSCSYSQARATTEKINDILDGKKLKPWILTGCGSTVYTPEGKEIKKCSIDKDFVKKYIKTAKQSDKDSILIFQSNEQNYVLDEKHSTFVSILFYLYRVKEKAKGATGMEFKTLQGDASSLDIQELLCVSAKSEDKIKVAGSLSKLLRSYKDKYRLYKGNHEFQTPAKTKEEGIEFILSHDKTFCPGYRLQDVIYFGDGANDNDMFKISKYSFARGKRLDNFTDAKYHYKDLSKVSTALYGDEINFDRRMENLPATDMSKASTKEDVKVKL